jgi:hypothetical protein
MAIAQIYTERGGFISAVGLNEPSLFPKHDTELSSPLVTPYMNVLGWCGPIISAPHALRNRSFNLALSWGKVNGLYCNSLKLSVH